MSRPLEHSRENIYSAIKDQTSTGGIVKASNELLALLSGCSISTLKRVLTELEKDGLISREQRIVKNPKTGSPVTFRFIILTDPNEPKRGFSIFQHSQLAKSSNHKVVSYPSETDGNTTYEWWRLVEGEWQLNMPDKDWDSRKHCWEFIHYARRIHKHIATTGDYQLQTFKKEW